MPIVPSDNLSALAFYETHGPIWVSNAAALGVPTALANTIKADATAARALYQAQQDAMAAAKSATLAWNNAMTTLRTDGSAGIAAIKAKADSSTDPDAVYVLAQIPPPAVGGTLPPPGQPQTPSFSILGSGALVIKWKMPGAQPGNTFYQLKRKLAGESTYTYIGGTGNKSYTDSTLPAGADNASYLVTAHRGNASGLPSVPFNVQFGVNGDGMMVSATSTGSGAGVKFAA